MQTTNSLKKRSDFDRVFRKGLKYKEGFLSLRITKNDFRNSRLGFVVSQKVSKKATTRNKIKRRLRAIANVELPKIKKGFDVVLIANQGLEKKDFWELEEIVDNVFRKAKLFKN